MHLPQGNSSLTSSFAVKPSKVRFQAQKQDEELYLLLRRHPITNVPWIFFGFVMMLLPVAVGPFVSTFFGDVSFLLQPLVALALFVFWYVLVLTYIFEQFLLWFFSAYIITNDRVVDFDFKGLFIREFSEAQLRRVQDVTSEVVGPFALMFNFGTVKVQTAAEETNIEFEDVPSPDAITRMIGELVSEKGGILSVRDK